MQENRSTPLETLLSLIPLFEGLDQETLARIACSAKDIRLVDHGTLFRKNDPCLGIHVVIHGQIKLFFTSAQGIDRVVDILTQDRIFGETQMFADQPYMVSAEALSDSLVLFIPKTSILEEFDRNPRLRLRLLARMSSNLHHLIAEGQAYSQHSGSQRFIGYLLRQIPEPLERDQNVTVTLTASKGNIASLLNLTREHLSRVFHSLSAQGLISVHGKRISIPNLARLKDYRGDSQPIWPQQQQSTCCKCNDATAGHCGLAPRTEPSMRPVKDNPALRSTFRPDPGLGSARSVGASQYHQMPLAKPRKKDAPFAANDTSTA